MRPDPLEDDRPVARARHVVDSFRFATAGLVYALRTQRNLRIHFFITLLVLLLALAVQLSRTELAVLLLTVGLVMAAELVNTAVEAVVDLASPQLHELARTAKNVAAGGVLLTSLVAVGVGALLFYSPLVALLTHQGPPGKPGAVYVVLIGAVLVLLAVWAAKARPDRWHLTGGMPSGHAAVAFALATAIYFTSGNGLLTLLGVALAVLVAESRMEGGIHTLAEVAAGAAVGTGVAALVFVLLS